MLATVPRTSFSDLGHRLMFLVLPLLAFTWAAQPVQAQCPSAWVPGIGTPGINGQVIAITVLPSGHVIAGGSFSSAGGVPVSRIARWNGTAWSPLGSGMNDDVRALIAMPNGDLIATGNFTIAGGTPANRIARWDGSAWSPLGTGLNNSANALALLTNSGGGIDLIAGGNFTSAGGTTVSNIARWNGTSWSALGAGLNSNVSALAVLPDGSGGNSLFAGGLFRGSGATPASYVARWNGSAWSALGAGTNAAVLALTARPNGSGGTNLIAGGFFSSAGAAPNTAYIASWNGVAWSGLGSGTSYIVTALTTLPNPSGPSSIIAAGPFGSAANVTVWGVGRWNGTNWSALGGYTDQRIEALAMKPDGVGGGDLYMAGSFTEAGSGGPEAGTPANRVAQYRFGASGPGISTPVPNVEACTSSQATFTVAAFGSPPLTYQWRKHGVPIDSSAGAGGNPSSATATLTLMNVQLADAANYDCVITSACGTVTSNPATLTLRTCGGCSPADIAGGGPDGRSGDYIVDGSDFIAFINSFSVGDPAIDPLADVAGSGNDGLSPDGIIDGSDFIAFINAFSEGC